MSKFAVGDIVHHKNCNEGTYNGEVIRIDKGQAIVLFPEWHGNEWGTAGISPDNDYYLRLIRKGGNTISNKFKVGDRVRIVRRNLGNLTGCQDYGKPGGDIGKVGTISKVHGSNRPYCVEMSSLASGYLGWFSDEELEPESANSFRGLEWLSTSLDNQIGHQRLAAIQQARYGEFKLNKGDSKMSIVSRIRNLTQTKEEKLRQKYNIVNDCGDRTQEGTDVLLDILFEQNAGEIDSKLAEIDKEDKADKRTK